MLKPLTLSVSLAIALGTCSLGMAGGFASSQCAMPSPQGCYASPQSCNVGTCATRQRCSLGSLFHRQRCYTYEWVLKKRRCWGGCATTSCGGCGDVIYPSSQCLPSGQYGGGVYGSGQYGGGGVYGAGQMGPYGAGQYGAGQMGAGQMGGVGGGTAPAGGGTGTEAPPAPEVPGGGETTPAPAAPEGGATPPASSAPAPPTASNGSGLLLLPAGN